MKIVSENSITLTLKEGKKWSAAAGLITMKSVTILGKSYALARLDGKSMCKSRHHSSNITPE